MGQIARQFYIYKHILLNKVNTNNHNSSYIILYLSVYLSKGTRKPVISRLPRWTDFFSWDR